eukprot:scaffold8374_cov175-Amphora_coffeaeformis.AAC.124
MEIADGQNVGVGDGLKRTAPKTKNGLRDHINREPSFEDLFKNTNNVVGRQKSSTDLFDDFEDPFEDERDHATTVTPVDKTEKECNSTSPKGVDDLDFDPFEEIGNKRSSFYHSPEIDGEINLRSSSTGSAGFAGLGFVNGNNKGEGDVPKTPSISGRRSTTSHFASVSDFRNSQGFENALAIKASAMKMGPRLAHAGDELSSRSGHGDMRALMGRRSSMSNLSLSNHSSHSTQSDIGEGGPPRRAGKKPGHFLDGSQHSTDSGFKVTAARPTWGRRSSTSNLNTSSHSDSPDFPLPGALRRGTKKAHSTDDAVPATPMTPMKMGIVASKRLSMTPISMGNRRASMSAATTQMMPTPKKATTKMVRRASVATGIGAASLTPNLHRRASVSSGLGKEESTSKMRIRIRQNRKGDGAGVKGPVDEENVRRLIKDHLAKERLHKEAVPSVKGPVDEDNVRRMIKEHIAKEKLKKKQEQKEKGKQEDDEGDRHDEENEDESNRSDSDDETSRSGDDDTSVSSSSSASSRWEDDAIYGDNAPKLLARQDSCDGDTLLDWTPDQSAEVLRGSRRAGRKPKKESNSKEDGNGEGKVEDEEERKARKKARKAVKKTKKEKKEKKVKKVKKEKKRSKTKSKSKSKEDNQKDDNHSVHLEGEDAMMISASQGMESSAASFCNDSDLEEPKSTKKKKEKKAIKKDTKKKGNKAKRTTSSAEKDEEGTQRSEDPSTPIDDDQSDDE